MTEAAKQQTAEKYVRSRWASVHIPDTNHFHWEVWLEFLDGRAEIFKDWSAAYAFTLEREEQIREIREEIALLRGMIMLLQSEPGDETAPIYQRTINRLQEIVTELRRGMK